MSSATTATIKSDPTLMSEIRKYGEFNTNACLQCGSCTVVCELTNDSTATFPRKSIQYALMGLKDPLKSGLEPWLCYYCGDCSTTCPRQTEPGEAMMTFRRYLTAKYDWTGLASKIYRSKIWEIGSLFLVGLFVLLLVGYYHLSIAELEYTQLFSEESISEIWDAYWDESPEDFFMGHMFYSGSKLAQTFVTIVFLFPLVVLLSNAFRMYWFTMRQGSSVKIPIRLYLSEAKTFLLHAVTQKRFRDCPDKNRWIKHILLVGACVLMFVIKFFFLAWFQTDEIYPIYHPQRWLGYLAAAILIYVTVDILIGRIKKSEQIQKFSELSDWTLPILLLLTAVSGLAIHICRYLELSMATHYLYAVHLAVVVPLLIIEIPFGKLAHVIYRPLAVYFQSVKDKVLQQVLNKEEVQNHVE